MKIKHLKLAPIKVEILISPCWAYKIETDSGTKPLEKTKCGVPNYFYTNKTSILKGNRQGFRKKL